MAQGYKSGLATGLALSGLAALLAPLWRPASARWGRPIAKGAVKGGLAAYELTRTRIAELGEQAEDLLAEAQLERATKNVQKSAPGPETQP